MNLNSSIYVAGHTGLVGSAIVRELKKEGYSNLILKTHKELDLQNQRDVNDFFREYKPEYVIVAAAKVGGIQANNQFMADFAAENLAITLNIIAASHKSNVKKLLYLGSSCIYPRECKQPIKEDYLLTGSLEPTNEGYAIAKIAGIRLCEYYNKQYGDKFISCIPANLYGVNDCFDPSKSHVIPALIEKFHIAKINNLPRVEIWGTGSPRREFMYIDDCAEACVFLLNNYDEQQTVNIGLGYDTSIKEIAEMICDVVGYNGELFFDASKPDGMAKRMLDSSKILSMGFKPKTMIKDGLKITYEWYLKNIEDGHKQLNC